MFDKKKIKKSNFKRKRTFKTRKKLKKKNTKGLLKLISFLVVSFFVISILIGFVLYRKYIVPLPPVEEIKNMHIAQTSTIYDKDGKELYKIFKENRTYVDYNKISKNMVNAIVAGEDQRFWTNPGFDIIGIIRAALYGLVPGHKVKGTSGLSQQLMKVTYLSNERSLERKVKELYLSWKLNKVFDKTKILELYLNKIFFGSNAYGIEQASKTFFGTTASDLNVLQSSILASLPKAPSGLSPYSHKAKLLGNPVIFDTKNNSEEQILTKKQIEENKNLIDKLTNFIKNLKFKRLKDDAVICNIDKSNLKAGSFRVDGDSCSTLGFNNLLKFLNSIEIKSGDKIIKYNTGRKDYILGRMLEDKYISFDDYKNAIISAFGYEFKKPRVSIKYPYFVMYIKEYLENKYGKDVINQGGLKIYTTLDSNLQDQAEALIKKYGDINQKRFGAKNDALIAIDNKTGGILSMVGGRDYFDEENGGNNNMILARLQPGSTFKPFTYALGIENNKIGSKTPIYDVKTTFPGGYAPHNFDGKFMGKMNISTALNNSRNIPAIKMFYLAGGEEKIIKFMEKLGVETLRKFKQEYNKKYPNRNYTYSAPMALGTGLMTPLELARAYSTFANLGIRKDINPIIKIEDSKGNIIEDREQLKKEEKPVISPSLAYIMNSILSDTSSRPSFWNKFMSLSGRKMAAKTGTSTKQFYKNGRKIIAPRNLWTIGYTPQITTVVWVGNTNGKELYLSGNGLEGAGPILKGYMRYAHIGKKVESWPRPFGVKTVGISEISGNLPREDFPKDFIVSSNFINSPDKVDNSLKEVEVDSLCNGKPTELTPENTIKKGYLIEFHSIDPSRKSWESGVQAWVKKGDWKEKYKVFGNIITDYSDEVCERHGKGNVIVKTSVKNKLVVGRNDIQLGFNGDRKIKKINIYIGDLLLKSIDIANQTKKGLEISIFLNFKMEGKREIFKIEAIDNEGYSYTEEKLVNIVKRPVNIQNSGTGNIN